MMYRVSGHLCDLLLQPFETTKPAVAALRLRGHQAIADFEAATGASIDDASAAIVSQYHNRPLSGKELKLLLALTSILAQSSQIADPKRDDYYTGTEDPAFHNCTTDSEVVTLKAPVLNVTPYDIARAFYPDRSIGGANTAEMKAMLLSGESGLLQPSMIRYTRQHRPTRRSKAIMQTLEDSNPLIAVEPCIDDTGSDSIIDGKLTITLHPIFIDSIGKKYIQLPMDLIKQIDSAGHSKESSITYLLIMELIRAHSNRKKLEQNAAGHSLFIIGKQKLLQHVSRQYIDPLSGHHDRPKRIEDMLLHAIEIAKGIGLLLDYSIRSGQVEDHLFVFELNPAYGTNG
jgi:hypothetical protein